jgi:hypothetical protein
MSLYERALTRMEALAAASAQGGTPWGPDRDLVSRETAADAVMDVFATLDALRQGVELPPNRIEHTLGMLMLIREYIVPLRRVVGVLASHALAIYVVQLEPEALGSAVLAAGAALVDDRLPEAAPEVAVAH